MVVKIPGFFLLLSHSLLRMLMCEESINHASAYAYAPAYPPPPPQFRKLGECIDVG